MIVYKDINAKIVELSKIIKRKKFNVEDYCLSLYKYLNKFKYEDIENVFKIEFSFHKKLYHKNGYDVVFWVLEIKDYKKITKNFTKEHFEAQKIFLNKINFNEKLKFSLERYTHRRAEKYKNGNLPEIKVNYVKNNQINTNTRQILSSHLIESPLNSPKNLFQTKIKDFSSIKKTRQLSFEDKKDESFEFKNEKERLRSTELIKKLFSKRFNPGGERKNWSKTKKRLVDAINKHNSAKNSVINTFVVDHIEKLPNNFNEILFLGKDLDLDDSNNDFMENVENDYLSHNEKTMMTSKQNSNFEIIDRLNKNIKNKERNMKKSLFIIRIFFFFSLILWFIFAIVTNGIIFSDKYMILDNTNSKEIIKFEKFYFNFNIFEVYAKLFHNQQKMSIVIRPEDLTIPHQLSSESYDNFFKRSMKEFKYFNKSYYSIFFLKQTWIYDKKNRELDFQCTFWDLVKQIKARNQKEIYFNKKLFENNMLENNYLKVSEGLFILENQISNAIDNDFKEINSKFFLYLYLPIFVFIGLNIIILIFSIKYISISDSIFILFSKIRYQDIVEFGKFFQDLYSYLKLSERNYFSKLLISHTMKTSKKTQRRNKIRNCSISKLHLFKFIFKFFILNTFFILPIFLKIYIITPKIKILYHQNIFLSRLAVYNNIIINQFWYVTDIYGIYLNQDKSKRNEYLLTDEFKEKKRLFNKFHHKMKELNYYFQFSKLYSNENEFKNFFDEEKIKLPQEKINEKENFVKFRSFFKNYYVQYLILFENFNYLINNYDEFDNYNNSLPNKIKMMLQKLLMYFKKI